jgi:hypothetical protein
MRSEIRNLKSDQPIACKQEFHLPLRFQIEKLKRCWKRGRMTYDINGTKHCFNISDKLILLKDGYSIKGIVFE